LDAAFFQVGETRGGLLVKFHGGESQASEDELRIILERNGLAVSRLEREERFRFVEETDPVEGRDAALERFLNEQEDAGRTLWASFNWTEQVSLDVALRQQEALKELTDAHQLVVKTGVVEEAADGSATIWIAESGLSLSRVTTPVPSS
jgi:hypothetical protein